jgi:hypothetical protein
MTAINLQRYAHFDLTPDQGSQVVPLSPTPLAPPDI